MKFNRYSGFTLVEMMIAMVVLAILITVGAPAFTKMIKDNRILGDSYALRAALDGARSEAIAQRSSVTFCRSSNGSTCTGNWNQGYIAFQDRDGNGVRDDVNDPNELYISKVIDTDTVTIAYSNAANRVNFDSQGYARGFQGTFTFCDDRGAPDARGVIVTSGGLVRSAQDPNDAGTVLDLGGVAVVCP